MAVFQPGEETAEGAQAMIDDGLFKRFPKPDVVLGQHVMVGPSGTVAGRAGAITSAAASGAPRKPEITSLDHYPLNVNDLEASKRLVDAFRGHFGAERVRETGPAPASEDFGSFGTEWHVPSVFWFVGGTDPETYAKAKAANKLNELPVNHSPKFAPVLHPTLKTGVETLVVATRAWLPT